MSLLNGDWSVHEHSMDHMPATVPTADVMGEMT